MIAHVRKKRLPEENTPPLTHWLTWLALLSVISAVVVLFGVWPPYGGDLWMHLTIGRWIWQQGTVPLVDDFSYLSAGAPLIAHSWGSEILFYLIEQHAGTIGFALLRLTLVSVALALAVWTARLLGASWPSVLLLAPMVLTLVWGRLEFRPQLFTTVFLAVELWLLVSVHTGRRSWRWLWGLPPLYALWINLHPGWPQGIVLLIAITAAVGVMALRRRWLGTPLTSHLPLSPLALVLGGCLLALLINPYGLRLVWFPATMQQSWIRAIGPEWQSPWTSPGWGMVGGGKCINIFPVFIAYTIALVGVLLISIRRWRTADLIPIAVLMGWIVLSSYHVRTVADAALMTAPILAASIGSSWWRARQWPLLVGIGLTLGLTALAGWCALWLKIEDQPYRDRLSCVATTIARMRPSGRIVSGHFDQVLLYQTYPAVRVPMTWEYVTGQARTAEYFWAWRGPLTDFVARYQVNVVILALWHDHGWEHLLNLVARGWTFVYMDDIFVIMTRQTAPYRPYQTIRSWGAVKVTVAKAPSVLAEAERALRDCPTGANFALAAKADALFLLGRFDEFRQAELAYLRRQTELFEAIGDVNR